MEFRILGPPEARDEGRQIALGGPQQRALLALLLLDANRVVSADRLVDDLWDGQPPPAARRLLQGCVARLRRALNSGEAQPLVTRPPGYLIQVRPGELDLDRFDELVAAADATLWERSPAALNESAARLREALALWRGPALDGIPTATSQAHARRLEERRQAALETRIDIDLCLGRHAELIGELQGYVQEQPLNERVWAQLMLALHGADRRADALAAYRELRRTLVEQLGVEPNATVRDLEYAVLTGADVMEVYRHARGPLVAGEAVDPASAAPRTTGPAGAEPWRGPGAGSTGPETPAVLPMPAQLPAAVAAFTGRAWHLDRLDACLADPAEDRLATVVITAIAGTAGVGKTALAVHWAHRVRHRFPDGQFYVNLRGYAPTPPLRPVDALAGFLHALGVPAEDIPVGLDQAAALYRTMLADKRVLVVLDNAHSPEQVRPLLPGGPGCVVLVTGRDRFDGLVVREGAERITLDVLGPDEATALLARIIGPDRVAGEPHAVAELAEGCARLPLALRIAAANLTAQPSRSIASLVADLTAGNRLATLRVEGDRDAAVRTAFDLSYAALPAQGRLLFRRLGLIPGTDVTSAGAAALAGGTVPETRPLLDRLVHAHLVAEHRPGRYTFHDLLRDYAADRAYEEETETARAEAIVRLFDWYVHTADAAARMVYPELLRLPVSGSESESEFGSDSEALEWLDAERSNLTAAIRYAAEYGPRQVAWTLGAALRGYFGHRMLLAGWLAAAYPALAAAEADANRRGQAASHLSLGDAYRNHGDFAKAITHYEHASVHAEEDGWLDCRAAALGNVGLAHWELGQLVEAVDRFAESLELNRQAERFTGQAASLTNLGLVCQDLGQLARAADYYADALALYRKVESRNGEALILLNLGQASRALGQFDTARSQLTACLQLVGEAGDRDTEHVALRVLANVDCDTGRYVPARKAAEDLLARARDFGDRDDPDDYITLAAVHVRLRDPERGIELYERALILARDIETRYSEAVGLLGLAAAHLGAGRPEAAQADAGAAVALARRTGYRLLEGQALTALADVQLALGHPGEASGYARQALAIHRETGHRPGEAQALVALAHAMCRTEGRDAARPLWCEALGILTDIGAADADEIRTLVDGG